MQSIKSLLLVVTCLLSLTVFGGGKGEIVEILAKLALKQSDKLFSSGVKVVLKTSLEKKIILDSGQAIAKALKGDPAAIKKILLSDPKTAKYATAQAKDLDIDDLAIIMNKLGKHVGEGDFKGFWGCTGACNLDSLAGRFTHLIKPFDDSLRPFLAKMPKSNKAVIKDLRKKASRGHKVWVSGKGKKAIYKTVKIEIDGAIAPEDARALWLYTYLVGMDLSKVSKRINVDPVVVAKSEFAKRIAGFQTIGGKSIIDSEEIKAFLMPIELTEARDIKSFGEVFVDAAASTKGAKSLKERKKEYRRIMKARAKLVDGGEEAFAQMDELNCWRLFK